MWGRSESRHVGVKSVNQALTCLIPDDLPDGPNPGRLAGSERLVFVSLNLNDAAGS